MVSYDLFLRGLLVKWLRRRPLTAKAWVRFPLGSPNETNPNYFAGRNWFGFVFLLSAWQGAHRATRSLPSCSAVFAIHFEDHVSIVSPLARFASEWDFVASVLRLKILSYTSLNQRVDFIGINEAHHNILIFNKSSCVRCHMSRGYQK